MANTAAPAMCCSRVPAAAAATASAGLLLLLVSLSLTSRPAAAEVRHVRHKRTVSDLMEGLMNAMYFHVDPMPMPSTVITRVTHLTAPSKVYKYVPVQTVKLSKLRARQIAEPKLRLKYPKKISIATEDSSLTLLKNDLPWTLHPLPPPLPTSQTIKVEVDKAMPWALHPLPPPMKTKNLSDYYWPDSKTRPKYYYRSRPQQPYSKPYIRYTNNHNYKYVRPKPQLASFKPTSEYGKPAAVGYKSVVNHATKPIDDYNGHVDHHNADGYKGSHVEHHDADEYKGHADHGGKPGSNDYHGSSMSDDHDNNYNHVDFGGGPDSYKYIDYKHIDYKHVDYKSPDYKPEYPKYGSADEELNDHDHHHPLHDHDDHHDHDHNDVYHYSHDDHSARINDSPSSLSQSQPPSSAEYVSHITIEPSIQIAAFSETELQGDGTNRDASSLSQGDAKLRSCQCTVNGHRHKRNADDGVRTSGSPRWTVNGTAANADDDGGGGNGRAAAVRKPKDSNAAPSSSRNAYAAPRVGHATDVQIVRSHDITDQSMMIDGGAGAGYVQQVRNMYDGRGPDVQPPTAAVVQDADRGQAAKKNDATAFRDESDKFKVDFGRDINSWDESKSAADKQQGRYSPRLRTDGGGGGGGGVVNSGFAEDYVNRPTRDKPDPRGRVYHAVQSKVKNTDRGVSFSVQTPFSVSSFSSNVRHPEERQTRFRYTGHNTESSASPFQNQYSESPLNFEQFGLKSALDDDRPPDLGHFTRDLFDDGQPETATIGRSRFQDSFAADRRPGSGLSGRLASHFSRDSGQDDRSRLKSSSKPFRYNAKHGSSQSVDDLFDIRSKDSRPSTEESFLEYFQPVVIDFDSKSKQDDNFKSFGGNNNNNYGGGNNNNNNYGGGDKSRYFGKTETSGFSKFKKNHNSDHLRLPGRLHESNENLSRKMLFHPSTFDIE